MCDPARPLVGVVGRDHELTTTILTTAEVRDLVERMLKTSGRRVDVSSPFVDAMLPSGHRLHVVLDGITRGFSAVNICDAVVGDVRIVVQVCGRSDHVGVAVDNPHNADIAVIVLR